MEATISETNPPTGEYGIYYLAEDEEPREYVDRYPHVVLPTLNSISIQWNTLQKTATTLYWGEDETCSNTISDEELVNEHLVKITGLQPGSKYFYRVVFNDITTEPEHFYTTKPATTENVKFFIIGDSGSNVAGVASSENQLAVTDKIMKKEYDFGLHAGDVNQTIGDEYDFIFYTGYKDILKNTPIFTCIGNHDTYHDNARTYLNSFYLPHNNPDSTERYYSFNYGPAHFIALDTDSPYSPGTPQYEWLVQDLQSEMRAETKWTIVYFHKPPWSEGWPEYPGEIGVRTNLVPLFEQYDIDLVFNGHTHDYERGILNDVCYVITGGGGCSLEPGGQYYDYDHVTVRVCEYHFTYISISGNTLQLEAINKDGVEIDNLVINKETNSVERDDNAVPEEMALFNNYPNPFNPATNITFRAAKDDHYSLRVYNLSGQQVAVLLDEHRQTGTYKVSFDASHLTSGTYFYRLQGGGMDMVKKMILLK